MRNVWKWLGLAGMVGVAASGAFVARDQRRRNAYTPDDIRPGCRNASPKPTATANRDMSPTDTMALATAERTDFADFLGQLTPAQWDSADPLRALAGARRRCAHHQLR